MTRQPKKTKSVKNIKHSTARRKNIPTAEMEPVVQPDVKKPMERRYPRNTDLDPQLMWRGKDAADWSDLVVTAPPLYIQEKIHPKALIDDLLRQTKARADATDDSAPDLFSHDFNGLLDLEAKTEFYEHDQNWSNRMILGDSLQVMASLAEREDLASRVQCIYFDPPYGIKFSSNWQVSTRSRDVKDGHIEHISREPEMVKAFRDTWRDGIHSYLTYLRDRLTVARDLLTDSGSIFVQIGDENVHRVRVLMDEVFGPENFVSEIVLSKTTSATSRNLAGTWDSVVWYAKKIDQLKYRQLYLPKEPGKAGATAYNRVQHVSGSAPTTIKSNEKYGESFPTKEWHLVASYNLTSQSGGKTTRESYTFSGKGFIPSSGGWKTNKAGLTRLEKSSRLTIGGIALRYVRRLSDFPVFPITNFWTDTSTGSFTEDKVYVVQSSRKSVERCILMATDPGDLVLDPTCGSGTTATVAEQWGRRWVTIDTSRVALALARARVMGAKYPYYLLADSTSGRTREAEITGKLVIDDMVPTEDIRHGFVYHRAPHITLKSIANNAEIDVIWDKWQEVLEPVRAQLNAALGQAWEEWEIPREVDDGWGDDVTAIHSKWWDARIARQQEIDANISKNADVEYLYDRPYEDKARVRVAGPFTVETLSPHRMLAVDVDGELVDEIKASEGNYKPEQREEHDFAQMVLDNLEKAGVHQMFKDQRIIFTGGITAHPGRFIGAVGRYVDGEPDADDAVERKAGIFIGPEYGTVQRADLSAAGREAAEMGFDVLISCAFNYDPQSSDMESLGALPIIKARINPDLHMADDLKNTGSGNLFVVFGEPDIETIQHEDGTVQIKINGVDIFNTKKREVESAEADQIAAWFIDTDYNEESFFVRHAYFLGGGSNDPYRQLKTSLKVEIDAEAWQSLYSDTSRPFVRPERGRIAVKVINHLGDEVMKVFEV